MNNFEQPYLNIELPQTIDLGLISARPVSVGVPIFPEVRQLVVMDAEETDDAFSFAVSHSAVKDCIGSLADERKGVETTAEQRWLAVPNNITNEVAYQQLTRARIPMFERRYITDKCTIFSIPTGARPLSAKVLRAEGLRRDRSLYIDDELLFRMTGNLCARVWRGTGALPVSAQGPDTILDNVAFLPFCDEETPDVVMLCPPYTNALVVPKRSNAIDWFGEQFRGYPEGLAAVAVHGFMEKT